MDFTGALMGMANASQGYLQGRQTAIQNNAMNQMNQLQLENTKTLLENQKAQQALHSQFIDQLMNQSAIQPPSLQPTGQQPVQPQQAQQPDPNALSQKWAQMADWAGNHGDIADAKMATDMASKFQGMAMDQQKTQSNLQVADIKRQQQSVAFAASQFGAAPRTVEGFQQALNTIMQSPDVSNEEKQNLQKVAQYVQAQPSAVGQWMDYLHQQGMSAAQQMSSKLDLQRNQQQQSEQEARQQHYQRMENLDQAKFEWEQKHGKVSAKAGKITEPSDKQVTAAAQFVQSQFPASQMINPATNDLTPDTATVSRQVAEFAQQLQQRTPGLTYMSAVSQAFDIMKKSEQIQTEDKTVSGFDSSVGSKDNPIPFQAGDDPKSLQAGKYYRMPDGSIHQYNGQ